MDRPSPNEWEDIPNIYEMPRNALDLAVSKKISKHFNIKAGIKDILNQQVTMKQTVDTTVDMSELTGGADNSLKYFKRDQITKSYKPGRYLTLGVTYKF